MTYLLWLALAIAFILLAGELVKRRVKVVEIEAPALYSTGAVGLQDDEDY